MSDKWFLELAQDYFGDDEIAAEFVENETYSPEMLYLLDSGQLDHVELENVCLREFNGDESTYWYDRDSDTHYSVTILS